MPRGRPRKNPVVVLEDQVKSENESESTTTATFQCSACEFTCTKATLAEKHILMIHYGSARINDPSNTPLTDAERITGYIKAQKLLKVLKCTLCSKSFRSGLGYKYHLDICGKSESETLRECEICGKMLRIHSLPIHIRTLHSNAKDEVTNGNGEVYSMTARKAFSIPVQAGKKRSSAIKALEHFKEILSDDEPTPSGSSAPTYSTPAKKRKKATVDEEEDYQIKTEDVEAAEEEEAAEDEESEADSSIDEENQENEGPLEVLLEVLDEDFLGSNINTKDLDDLLFQIKQHIKRKLTRPVPNRTLEEELVELEADKAEDNSVAYTCYNEGCQKLFTFRTDMENHYRKCCSLGFLFACVGSPDCTYKNKLINMQMFKHFYQRHADLLPQENKLAQMMFAQMGTVKKRTVNAVGSAKRKAVMVPGGGSGSPAVDSGIYAEEQEAERCFNYTKEWIRFLRDNEKPMTYRCLAALRNQWKVVLGSAATPSSIVPRFKLTKSMESSGDNDFKFVPPLYSALNEGSYTFNVGQFICSSAWAIQPLPPNPADIQPNRVSFSDLLKMAKNDLKPAERVQYLAIATGNYEESILNMNMNLENPKKLPENSLQLWDCGPLESNPKDTVGVALADAPLPRLALNMVHNWGDIQEMAWCPTGSTYEAPVDDPKSRMKEARMARLGLLALACEDGRVRILSLPHPNQLSGSYDTNVRFYVEPVLMLQPRFSNCRSSVSSIAWSKESPQSSIIAGFGDGTICLWDLEMVAKCAAEDCKVHVAKQIIRPKKWWINPKCCPVLTIRWMNPMMFFTTGSDTCRVWNLRHDVSYGEHSRNIVHKVEAHPLWYNTFIFFDMSLNRANNLILMKTFGSEEHYDATNNCDCTKLHTVANVAKMRLNDISISPWMYILAYCNENGELYTSQLLPKPFRYPKRMNTFLLYNIRLGDLINFDTGPLDDEMILPAEEGSTNTQQQENSLTTTINLAPKRLKMSKKKMLDRIAKSHQKANQLINEVIDVEHSYQDFFLKYFMIFDDSKKFNLNRSTSTVSKGPGSSNSNSDSMYLTKNDLYRFYAITNCSWNPNLPAYSWLFSATKSGICRLNSYPLVNPQRNLNC